MTTNVFAEYPSVAIVILSWNGQVFLEKFLPSICASSYPNLKIYVADNASTDNSIVFLQQHFPQVNIICNRINEGFAKGYNTALSQVHSDYYVLLNQDVEVTPGWIEPIISLMGSQKNIAACQPKILSFHEKNKFEYAGAAGGWIDYLGYPFCRGRIFNAMENDEGQYNEAQKIFWASGAALFIKSKLYHAVNGLDDFFFAHMEEIDLCWRLQIAGYYIACCPQSVVYHVGGGSLPQGNPRKTYLNFRNNLIMLAKNLPASQRKKKIFYRLCLDGLSVIKSCADGRFSDIGAIRRAHRDFKKWYRENKYQLKMDNPPMEKFDGVYPRSIVKDYYLGTKKTFSRLKREK